MRVDLAWQATKLGLDDEPCVNDVHMAADNKFGFVEFRSAQACRQRKQPKEP